MTQILYAHVTGDTVDYQGTLPNKPWKNPIDGEIISNLSLSEGNDEYLKSLGWVSLIEISPDAEMGPYQCANPDKIIINEDHEKSIHSFRDMTDEEKIQRDKDAYYSLRWQRDERLVATDWCSSSDITMPDDIKVYRQALRDIPETCDISKFDGHEFKWPEKPEWFDKKVTKELI